MLRKALLTRNKTQPVNESSGALRVLHERPCTIACISADVDPSHARPRRCREGMRSRTQGAGPGAGGVGVGTGTRYDHGFGIAPECRGQTRFLFGGRLLVA